MIDHLTPPCPGYHPVHLHLGVPALGPVYVSVRVEAAVTVADGAPLVPRHQRPVRVVDEGNLALSK